MAKEKIDSFFGEDTQLKGELRSKSILRMDGVFEGTIYSPDTLIVGKTAQVTADLETGALYNMGNVTGNVVAKNFISIHADSSLVGDINTPVMVSEERAFFQGKCTMPKRERVTSPGGPILPKIKPQLIETPPHLKPEPIERVKSNFLTSISIEPKKNHLIAVGIVFLLILITGASYRIFSGENEITGITSFDMVHQGNPVKEEAPEETTGVADEGESWFSSAMSSITGAFTGDGDNTVPQTDLAEQIFSDEGQAESIELPDLGQSYMEQGNFKEAGSIFQKALASDKDNQDLRIQLANARILDGNYKEAFLEYQGEEDPETLKVFGQVLSSLENLYKVQESPERLIFVLEQMRALNKKDPAPFEELAILYRDSGENRKAISVYLDLIKLQSKEVNHYLNLARLYIEIDQLKEGMNQYRQGLKLDPNHLQARYELGFLYDKQGNHTLADKEYSRITKIDSEHIESLNNRAYRLLDRNRLREATRDFNQIISQDPENIRALYGFTSIYVKRDQNDKVESQCKTILEIDEDYTPAMNRLAWTYARQGIQLKEAEELSLNSMKYDPQVPEYLDTLSEIYFQMEDYEKAVQLINKAITLRPNDSYFKRQLQKFQNASKTDTDKSIAANPNRLLESSS